MLSYFRLYNILFCFLISPILFGQLPKTILNPDMDEAFNPKDFSSKKLDLKSRIGVYHFGDSEGEWSLVLLLNGDDLIVQVWYGIFGTDFYTKKETWLSQCKTFNNVRVSNNKFYFGKYSGLFAERNEVNKINNAVLLFYNPITEKQYGKDTAEIGQYSLNLEDYFSNKKYSALSTKMLDENYFTDKTKNEMKIMRNEIFAKYGLIFQSGGEMEKYFREQIWYAPHLTDVSDCLTTIEKENIKTLFKLEQAK